ncbi:MAG: serine hydrolase [Parvularculaceae bacterium]|nr:serine hydrolase [Parvularculaceae bacterium]
MRARLAGLLLAMAPGFAGAAGSKHFDRDLEAIVAGEATGNPLAGAVIAVKVGDEVVYAGAAGCASFDDAPVQKCLRRLTPDSKMRVASISKMAAAMAAIALEREGLLDLDRDVSDYLGWSLRNPAYPEAPITARQLMTHLSSLRDPDEYWVAAPGEFRALIEATRPFAVPEPGASRKPGDYFTYANINYGVLATVLELAARDRFDRVVGSRILAPLKLDAGFNWSGVSPKARRRAATLYRVENRRWTAQTDDADMLAASGPYFLRAEELDAAAYLAAYVPGANATLFSPQGGLRASVLDLLRLHDARGDVEIVWRFDPEAATGDPADGLYPAAGIGTLAIKGEGPLWPGVELVGHSGEAYGLLAGLWRAPADPARGRDRQVSFAYAITGTAKTPQRGGHPSFYDVEEPLVRLAMAVAAQAGVSVDGEPRPFDKARDAMADVDETLRAAEAGGKRVLLVLGGNWCHDSRSFAMMLADPSIADLVRERYETVFVDVGRRDRNLDVPKRFGVHTLMGTPTILILSAGGELLNPNSVHQWRNAADRPLEDIRALLGFEAD